MTRIAYSYIRFSSAAQAQGNSLRRQTEMRDSYLQRKGLILDDSLNLRDLGVSAFRGTNVKEGALAGFLEACRIGRVKRGSMLIVESLDRLSRDQIRPALTLFMSILEHGVTIVTLEPEREYTPEQSDAINIIEPLFIFARGNEESVTKSTRVKDAWNERRKNATEKPITGKCPGWLRLTNGHFEEIKLAADAVRLIYQLCIDGHGVRRITDRLVKQGVAPFGRSGHWTMPYVNKLLRFRAVFGEFQPYLMENGKRVPAGDPIPNYYPVVVTESEFYQAQSMLRTRKGKGGRGGADSDANLFTGLLRHAEDKTTMVLKRPTGGEQKYLYLMSSSYLLGQKKEGSPNFPYWPFEEAVLRCLCELQAEDLKDKAAEDRDDVAKQIDALDGELLALEEKLKRTNEAAAKADMDKFETYLGLIGMLRDEKKEKSARRERLKAEASAGRNEALKDTQSLLTMLEHAQGDERTKLRCRIKGRLQNLVKEIWLLIERIGQRRVAHVQVYLHSGRRRDITIHHPVLKPTDPRPRTRSMTNVDLRNYAATANCGEAADGL